MRETDNTGRGFYISPWRSSLGCPGPSDLNLDCLLRRDFYHGWWRDASLWGIKVRQWFPHGSYRMRDAGNCFSFLLLFFVSFIFSIVISVLACLIPTTKLKQPPFPQPRKAAVTCRRCNTPFVGGSNIVANYRAIEQFTFNGGDGVARGSVTFKACYPASAFGL